MTLTQTTEAGLNQTNTGEHGEKKLSWQDWIMLPLLGLLTISVISAGVGFFAARTFGQSAEGIGKCMQLTDQAVGVHGKPNAVCFDKGHETTLIEYRLNNCGYRMDLKCGPPQPGTYRIVTIGSSIVMGQWISRERSLAALLPGELSSQTGRRIEIYNEGILWEYPQVAALRFDEVLAAKPNMVLWVLTPAEIGYVTVDPASLKPVPPPVNVGLAARGWNRLKRGLATGTIVATASEAWQKVPEKFLHSSTGVMLLHFLYQSQTRYVDSYLQGPDSTAGFLRAELSPAWSNDLKQFDKAAAKIEEQARAEGIPLAVVLVPNRAQAAVISMGKWSAGFDPYKLGKELRPIVEKHGGTYIDILSDFRRIPNPESYYFPVDGHPNADGNALLSRLLAKELTGGALPALNAERQAQRPGRDR